VREEFEISPSELLTAIARSMRNLEAGDGSPMADRVHNLIEGASHSFVHSARPRGVWQKISLTEFSAIYRGEGGNDPTTPVEDVLEEATSLALFAATVGDEVSSEVPRLFEVGELAEGYILDQIASFAADEMAQLAARRFALAARRNAEEAVLPYSPGYCGWNVSGQRALFEALDPEEIGITLNDSFLMSPIKSVSGVLILAPIGAHDFSPSFVCCASCTTLDCQERTAGLRERASSQKGDARA
jgi:hypothetical protein